MSTPMIGYRLIADELVAAGHQTSERRVWRLCRDHRVWSTTTRKGRRSSGKTPGPAAHDDLVQRDFTAPAPDRVWLTDIERHEALSNRAVVKGHGHRLVAACRLELRAA